MLVPLGLPDILALGAAIGTPACLISSRAIFKEGIRTPTVWRLAETILGTVSFSLKL